MRPGIIEAHLSDGCLESAAFPKPTRLRPRKRERKQIAFRRASTVLYVVPQSEVSATGSAPHPACIYSITPLTNIRP